VYSAGPARGLHFFETQEFKKRRRRCKIVFLPARGASHAHRGAALGELPRPQADSLYMYYAWLEAATISIVTLATFWGAGITCFSWRP
jgi:hypothetical protein